MHRQNSMSLNLVDANLEINGTLHGSLYNTLYEARFSSLYRNQYKSYEGVMSSVTAGKKIIE